MEKSISGLGSSMHVDRGQVMVEHPFLLASIWEDGFQVWTDFGFRFHNNGSLLKHSEQTLSKG